MAETTETRRDTLSAALDKVVESQPAAEPAEPVQAADTSTDITEVKADKPAGERVRDNAGKFAKGEKTDLLNGFKAIDGLQKTILKDVPAQAARKYPSSWKKDYEPVWNEVASHDKYKVLLDEVERRESDLLNGFKAIDEDSKYARTVRNAVAPFEATIRTLGVPMEQAIAGLLASDHALRYGSPAHKTQAIQRLFQSYGLDPQSIFQSIQQGAPQVDPNMQYLQQQLQQVQQQNQQLHSNYQRQVQEQAVAEVEAFKKDKPHFEEVRGEMSRLIQAGICSTQQDAYERAIYADPVIRGKVLAEQSAKAEAERKQKAQQDATRAKTAGVQVKGAPTGDVKSTSAKSKGTRREQLAAALNEAL